MNATAVLQHPADISASLQDKVEMPASPHRWILGPAFDLLFICGGLPLLLMAFNALAIGWTVPWDNSQTSQRWMLLLVLVGQHIFADAHNAATYVRIWRGQEDRKRFRFYRTWLIYISLALFGAGLYEPRLISILVYAYLVAVFWHYAAQTFGISLIYCFKRGYRLSSSERWIFRRFIQALCVFSIAQFVSYQRIQTWFGVPMPFIGPLPIMLMDAIGLAFTGFAIAFAYVLVKKAIVEQAILPLPSALLILTICCLGFSQGMANAMMWFYVPAFFHGSQYIAVCLSYYLKEKGLEEGASLSEIIPALRGSHVMLYLGTVVVTGALLYVGVPVLFGRFGYDMALMGGLVLAVVNFHHFITDAAIWRLRDPRCRAILVS